MMVGAHNTVDVTVECQVHMGGCVGFFRKGGCWYLQKYCWYVRSPTMCTRYGESWHPQYYRCPEACGGLIAVREPNGAYNTVDTNVGAYNTVCVRAVEEHCSRRRAGYGPSIVV